MTPVKNLDITVRTVEVAMAWILANSKRSEPEVARIPCFQPWFESAAVILDSELIYLHLTKNSLDIH